MSVKHFRIMASFHRFCQDGIAVGVVEDQEIAVAVTGSDREAAGEIAVGVAGDCCRFDDCSEDLVGAPTVGDSRVWVRHRIGIAGREFGFGGAKTLTLHSHMALGSVDGWW